MKWLIGSLIAAATVALLPANASAAVPSPYKVQGWITEIASTPGADTLWSVKRIGNWDDNPTYQLVAYEPGSGWTAYDAPSGPRQTQVTDLSMISAADGWATAGKNGMLHWDGSSWQRPDAPVFGSADVTEQVGASAANDVWVTGAHVYDPSTWAPRVWHFDGTAWSRVNLPLGPTDTVDDVLALAPDDVWISGSHWDGSTDTAFTLHWDGEQWRDEPLPGNPSWTVQLAGSSPDNVWLVQSDGSNQLVRWDGTQWTETTAPGEPPYDPVAIDPAPGGSLWSFNSYQYLSQTDGSSWSWSQLHASCQWDRDYGMGDLEVVAPDDIYIVGACYGWRSYTAVYHFDGEHFTRI